MAAPSVELEKQVVAQSAIDPAYRAKAKQVIGDLPLTDAALTWLWRQITDAPQREAVPKEAMDVRVQVTFSEESKRELHQLVVDEVYRYVEAGSPETSLQAVEELASYSRLETTLVHAAKKLEDGDIDQAWSMVSGLRRPTSASVGGDGSHIRYIETLEERHAEQKEAATARNSYIPTRIKSLDALIQGIKLEELGLIVGTTGRGKSIIAVNLSFSAAVTGFYVAHFSTEMSGRQVALRFDSRITRIEHNKFKNWSFSKAEEAKLKDIFDRRRKQLAKRLHIYDAPIRKCSIDYIQEQMEQTEREDGITFDMVVIDSPEHFDSDRQYKEKRHEITDVFWDMKAMARGEGRTSHKMAVWATVQAGQEWEHKVASARSVSEAYNKARIADIITTYNQTAEQELNGEMIGNLAKYRDGESRRQFKLLTDFKRMTFVDLGPIETKPVVDKESLVKDSTKPKKS